LGDAPGHLGRRFIVSPGLESQCLSGSRPIETAREPGLEVRYRRKVHVDSAANDRGDIKIGHREIVAEQKFLLGHCRVENLKRRRQNLQRLIAFDGITLGRRQADGVQRPDVDAAIDLGDGPKAPLPSARLTLERAGIEVAIGVLLGEIERDCKRLEQHEAVVRDEGQAPVWIDREKLRRAGASSADLDRQVLVVETELIRHPERSERAGAGDAVNAQAGQAVSQVLLRSIATPTLIEQRGVINLS
jgi:hypothetical protein